MSDLIQIAGLGIRWNGAVPEFFSDFSIESHAGEMMTVTEQPQLSGYGICYPQTVSDHVLLNSRGGYLTANQDWSHVTVSATASQDSDRALLLAAISSRFSYFDTLLLHASFVEHNGKGVVFVGPSGIGKTTQARLWNDVLGADIVNGDKILLRIISGTIHGCGLPWKGSSPYCQNRRAPVWSIVALRQAQTNRIRRLNSLECMEYFMPHVFLPHWDTQCVERALDTMDRIICQIPIWLLECRPDEEAVQLTFDTIMR